MKLTEAANKVIDLATKIRDYYTPENPKYHPNYPLISIQEPSPPKPQEEKDLRQFLDSLDSNLVYQLITVMYLGRGDFEPNDLPSFYEQMKQTFGNAKIAGSQMMEKAPLADYLIDGLNELKQNHINVDDPANFKKA